MKFNIFKGQYPFNEKLGTTEADNAEVALSYALAIYGEHCVVQPSNAQSAQQNHHDEDA